MTWVTNDAQYVHQRVVGFSGVIFTLAVMESYRSTQPTRSVFGMVRVPTRVYPWVLLIVLSVSKMTQLNRRGGKYRHKSDNYCGKYQYHSSGPSIVPAR